MASAMTCIQLLDRLLSHDQSIRAPAEAKLQAKIDSDFAQTLVELIQVISQGPRDDLKEFAAVCVRRALKSRPRSFSALSSDIQRQLKEALLKLCSEMTLKLPVRRKTCDIVEVLASQLIPNKQWPNLMTFILQLLTQDAVDVVTIGLYLLGLVATVEKLEENDVQQLLNILRAKLQHSSTDVRVEAITALSRVSGMTDDISTLIPSASSMLQLVASDIGLSNTTTVLECLTEIARIYPELFEQTLDMVQQLTSSLVNSPNTNIDAKSLALEFVVVLVEANPSPIRKKPKFIESSFDAALTIMCAMEHDSVEWNEDEDDGEQQDFDTACESLCRLYDALGVKSSFLICKQRIDQLLQADEWNYKYAGLNLTMQVMDLLKKKKMKALHLWNKIHPFVRDGHPRVRHAAISCLAIMCSDFGKKFITRYSEKILECFYSGMQDTENPRVQSLSTKCLVNFCEKASQKTFLKHLEQIVEVLIALCKNTSVKYVQEQVCNAMAEVANTAGDKYRPYYGKFSGSLIAVLQADSSDADEYLKMEALRCLTYIGRAVGPELFAKEAAIAMKASLSYAQLNYDTKQLLNCWGRIAETLGERFAECLGKVVQSAAMFAGQQVEQTNFDDGSDEGEHKIVEFNDSFVALDINKLEEKECGLTLLGKLATSCPMHFSQFLHDCINSAMPLISYPHSASIRSAALESMSGFCQCVIANVQKHPEESKSFFIKMLRTFCQRLGEETKMSVKALIAYSIYSAISKNKEFAQAALEADSVKMVVQSLIECVKTMNGRVNDRQAKMMAPCLEEEDVAEIAKENEEERELCSDVTDALKSLLEIYQTDLLQMILMSDFEWMLSDDAHPIQRSTVLRIFCYIFETCPIARTRELMTQATERFIKCMDDEDCDVRQAAIYAIGLVAEQMKGSFNAEIAEQVLGKCFQHFEETGRDDGFDAVLDNDASVIGKVLRFQPQALKSIDKVYALWLQKCFPIREDTQEAIWCYDYFCELIQNNNTGFLGDNMRNLGLVMNSMVDAYGTSLMSEDSEKIFRKLVQDLQTNNKSLFAQSFSSMKEEYQKKLMQMISGTQI